ncbi:MAG: FHA domain-containing protein [Anaerolineales bacterium]|nr:FHA domain-containing protein [Anaerolineales bacterium]
MHSFAEVVDQAQSYNIPVNTIGLFSQPADINRQELEQMAEETAGFSAIGSGPEVGDLFRLIFTGLNSQYRASFGVKAEAGPKRGLLEVAVSDAGDPLYSNPFTFIVPRDFVEAPTAPTTDAIVNGINFDPARGIYDVSISLANPTAIDRVIVTVEGDNGVIAFENAFALNGQPTLLVPIDGKRLDVGREYKILVRAEDAAGICIPRPPDPNRVDQKADCLLADKEFKHELPKAPLPEARVRSIKADYSGKTLLVELELTQEERIDEYTGFIRDGATGQKIGDIGHEVYRPGAPLKIPMPPAMLAVRSDAPDGQDGYEMVLSLETDNGEPIELEAYPFKATPPAPPSWWEQLGAALAANPAILFGIVLILFLLTLWILYGRRKQKPAYTLDKPLEEYTVLGNPEASPARPGATITLRVLQTPHAADRKTYTVERFPCVIGRDSSCDVAFPGDRQISRKHAQITVKEGEFSVADLGSGNGTWLEDRRLTPNQPTKLRDIQQLKLGKMTVIEIRIRY